MTLSKAVEKRLRKILKEKGLTQRELEKLSNTPHPTLSGMLNGKNEDVDLKTLIKICRAINISLYDFFDYLEFESDSLEVE